MDEPNEVVDPDYMFFGDATLHGLFVPIAFNENDQLYESVLGETYTNGDLMQLTSSLVWLLQGGE